MVLGFSTHFPNGQPTNFVSKILLGTLTALPISNPPKIHTIRAGERWKKGDRIHMATGVRTKKYNCFNNDFQTLHYVASVQEILIKNLFDDHNGVWVDGRKLSSKELETLAQNDGFDNVNDFWDWFKWQDFTGQIIHCTNKRY